MCSTAEKDYWGAVYAFFTAALRSFLRRVMIEAYGMTDSAGQMRLLRGGRRPLLANAATIRTAGCSDAWRWSDSYPSVSPSPSSLPHPFSLYPHMPSSTAFGSSESQRFHRSVTRWHLSPSPADAEVSGRQVAADGSMASLHNNLLWIFSPTTARSKRQGNSSCWTYRFFLCFDISVCLPRASMPKVLVQSVSARGRRCAGKISAADRLESTGLRPAVDGPLRFWRQNLLRDVVQ